MGWSEGEGLGRAKQGIVEPIKVLYFNMYGTWYCMQFNLQAERRTASAGLGSTGSNYAGLYSSGGSYRDTLKQLTRARYEEAFK